ncbi:MAG: hypothetical protein M5U34_34155 [Chloroflexi bacterium]|nr:hypothetical protein [Chloroflexota bacterium]
MTRVVVEEAEVVGGSGIAPAVPLPQPTAVMPLNPYEIGDEVTLTGMVQVLHIVAEDGEEHLEATFVNDGEQGEVAYLNSYPLLAEQALLAEMAAFNNLHIRVNGRIVAPPEDSFSLTYVTGYEQALAVDSFDRPWPDEKIEQFLGHFSLEELEGRPRLVFTDHATDQQYVINPPDMPPQAFERDESLQEAQILLAGVVHPLKTFAGLPLLDRRTIGTGSEFSQATDVSQFPPPAGDGL